MGWQTGNLFFQELQKIYLVVLKVFADFDNRVVADLDNSAAPTFSYGCPDRDAVHGGLRETSGQRFTQQYVKNIVNSSG